MQRRHFRAPLIFNAEKFSRKYKSSRKITQHPTLFGFGLKVLYVYLLLSIDMLLFASSGNLSVFADNMLPSFEVMLLLLFLMFFSFIILGAFYKKPMIQNGICCFFTFWFVVVLFNQFYQLDSNTVLGEFVSKYLGSSTPRFLFSYSHIMLAFILSLIFAGFIFKVSDKIFGLYVMVYLFVFMGIILKDSAYKNYKYDFVETYNSQLNDKFLQGNKKFIYIMLPNLVSYKYFSLINNPMAKQASDIITGFYAKNNFEVYPYSFTEHDDQFLNVVQSVNTFSNQHPYKYTQDTMMLYKYWKFFNINDEYVFLKENQMFDSFRKAGYKISAYKSRGVDICHKQHKFNVDRCMEKINRPVNLYDSGIARFDRTQLLFAEWISSMNILNIKPLHKFLKFFSDIDSLPLIGINYNNLYVINSIKTFDILAEHILSDEGRHAYFVYADIPSDMFIYDEFCNIKPREKWVSMENLPWINHDKTYLKQVSYIDQTKCLYGKLQEFIDKLNRYNVLDNSVLIINGMSSNRNFNKEEFEASTDEFIYDKMVALAIKSPMINELQINNELCSARSIIHRNLYNANSKTCSNVENIGIRGRLKDDLMEKLIQCNDEIDFSRNIIRFNNWYKQWCLLNNVGTQSVDIAKEEKSTYQPDINNKVPSLDNTTLR